ncbi:MAG TPA: NAD-dependent epimerase/dehydratase family protein [Planctomycetota bacterium]|nr:NAD-dependent epimerase/dehydratase family protein [Planctomycetota bacterium]
MKCLVTGGGGFLGREIVERLRARGDEVLSISRSLHPELEILGARTLAIELNERERLLEALQGIECVFHTAAKAGVWGSREEFWRTNFAGTLNLLQLCQKAGVAKFVYTSSPSVCFDGRDHFRASNDLPYAKRFLAPYPASKAAAEHTVRVANGNGGLATFALRPHLIIGPRDPHLLPRLVARARSGALRIVGSGENEVTLCAVENAAHAHLLAADTLTMKAQHAGRAYFIGQEQPVLLWPWIAELLERMGVPPPKRRISAKTAYALGALCELTWSALRKPGDPPMTRFLAAQLSRSHSYDMSPARRDFGYREILSLPEATEAIARAGTR